jgi:hypothetical protein
VKRLKYAIGLLIIIPLLIVCALLYLKQTTTDMREAITQAQSYAQIGDREAAQEKVGEFIRLWDKNKDVMATFIKHHELDVVNLSYVKLLPYLESGNMGDFNSECDMLKTQLDHIFDTEKFNIDNVL